MEAGIRNGEAPTRVVRGEERAGPPGARLPLTDQPGPAEFPRSLAGLARRPRARLADRNARGRKVPRGLVPGVSRRDAL